MKALIVILAFYVTTVFANPEISVNANSSFCHWPQDANNANNESFQGSCTGTVTQNADGTGTGSVRMVVKYPYGQAPYSADPVVSNGVKPIVRVTRFNGATAPNLDCEMDDTNGTAYVSADDWEFSAIPKDVINPLKVKQFEKHFFTDDAEHDFNGDGFVDYADMTILKYEQGYTEVTYYMTCRNGAQQ